MLKEEDAWEEVVGRATWEGDEGCKMKPTKTITWGEMKAARWNQQRWVEPYRKDNWVCQSVLDWNEWQSSGRRVWKYQSLRKTRYDEI